MSSKFGLTVLFVLAVLVGFYVASPWDDKVVTGPAFEIQASDVLQQTQSDVVSQLPLQLTPSESVSLPEQCSVSENLK